MKNHAHFLSIVFAGFVVAYFSMWLAIGETNVAVVIQPIGLVVPTGTPVPTTATATFTATNTPLPTTSTPISTIISNQAWSVVTKTFGDGVKMVEVPPGCFQMGMTKEDADALNKQYGITSWFSDSTPPTRVCFTQPFWIDKDDVTNEQFTRLNGQANRPSNWNGNKRPRESITWSEARDFCASRGAQLPTEAEWEYAARGPDDWSYPWGNNFNPANTVHIGNSGSQTADVGSKPGGNSWVGATDMAGNVWQWTSTLYKTYPYQADDGREGNTYSNTQL